MIILPTMRGVLCKAVVAEYSGAPSLVSNGSAASLTNNGTNTPSALSTASDNLMFVYANRPISGKKYWEVVVNCGIILPGVKAGTTSPGSYGGYSASSGAAVLYTYGGNVTVENTGSSTNSGNLVRAVDKRYGIAVDTVAKTLSYYVGNVVQTTVSINTANLNANPLYAHIGGQDGYPMSGESCGTGACKATFAFGAGCLYAAPGGFTYL